MLSTSRLFIACKLPSIVNLPAHPSCDIPLDDGSIRASRTLYARLLEIVLFATTRFHDTVSRGRLLNRFGKDFEGIDSSLANNFALVVITAISAVTTFVTIGIVGGWPFMICALLLYSLYWRCECSMNRSGSS